MNEVDPNLSPPRPNGLTELIKKVGETTFFRRAMIYRAATLRGILGVGIATLTYFKSNPTDYVGTAITAMVAWRLFLDSSMHTASGEAQKVP